jgi:hypothetical protein
VLERGLAFVQQFSEVLSLKGASGEVPPLLRHAWTFAAAVSLAATVSRLQQAQRSEARRSDQGGRASYRRSARASAEGAGAGAGAGRGTPGALPFPPLDPSVTPPSEPPTTASPGGMRLAAAAGQGGGDPVPLAPRSEGLPQLPPRSATETVASPGSVRSMRSVAEGSGEWKLGALPRLTQEQEEQLMGGRRPAAAPGAHTYSIMGQLYATARDELAAIGRSCGLSTPSAHDATLAHAAKLLGPVSHPIALGDGRWVGARAWRGRGPGGGGGGQPHSSGAKWSASSQLLASPFPAITLHAHPFHTLQAAQALVPWPCGCRCPC